jgi:hypothetical protein
VILFIGLLGRRVALDPLTFHNQFPDDAFPTFDRKTIIEGSDLLYQLFLVGWGWRRSARGRILLAVGETLMRAEIALTEDPVADIASDNRHSKTSHLVAAGKCHAAAPETVPFLAKLQPLAT